MADMFKPRKIPKHLILKDNYVARRKSSSLLKWACWFLVLLVVTGLALELEYLNAI